MQVENFTGPATWLTLSVSVELHVVARSSVSGRDMRVGGSANTSREPNGCVPMHIVRVISNNACDVDRKSPKYTTAAFRPLFFSAFSTQAGTVLVMVQNLRLHHPAIFPKGLLVAKLTTKPF